VKNLNKSRDSGLVTMAITRFHIQISSAAFAKTARSLHRKNLRSLGPLRVQIALSGDNSGSCGDNAPEIGVGRGESGGIVSDLSGAFDVGSVQRMGSMAVVAVTSNGLAEYGRRVKVGFGS